MMLTLQVLLIAQSGSCNQADTTQELVLAIDKIGQQRMEIQNCFEPNHIYKYQLWQCQDTTPLQCVLQLFGKCFQQDQLTIKRYGLKTITVSPLQEGQQHAFSQQDFIQKTNFTLSLTFRLQQSLPYKEQGVAQAQAQFFRLDRKAYLKSSQQQQQKVLEKQIQQHKQQQVSVKTDKQARNDKTLNVDSGVQAKRSANKLRIQPAENVMIVAQKIPKKSTSPVENIKSRMINFINNSRYLNNSPSQSTNQQQINPVKLQRIDVRMPTQLPQLSVQSTKKSKQYSALQSLTPSDCFFDSQLPQSITQRRQAYFKSKTFERKTLSSEPTSNLNKTFINKLTEELNVDQKTSIQPSNLSKKSTIKANSRNISDRVSSLTKLQQNHKINKTKEQIDQKQPQQTLQRSYSIPLLITLYNIRLFLYTGDLALPKQLHVALQDQNFKTFPLRCQNNNTRWDYSFRMQGIKGSYIYFRVVSLRNRIQLDQAEGKVKVKALCKAVTSYFKIYIKKEGIVTGYLEFDFKLGHQGQQRSGSLPQIKSRSVSKNVSGNKKSQEKSIMGKKQKNYRKVVNSYRQDDQTQYGPLISKEKQSGFLEQLRQRRLKLRLKNS